MNRRSFLRTLGLGALTIPFIAFRPGTKKEVESVKDAIIQARQNTKDEELLVFYNGRLLRQGSGHDYTADANGGLTFNFNTRPGSIICMVTNGESKFHTI